MSESVARACLRRFRSPLYFLFVGGVFVFVQAQVVLEGDPHQYLDWRSSFRCCSKLPSLSRFSTRLG